MAKAAWRILHAALGLGAAAAWVVACSGTGATPPTGSTGSSGSAGSGAAGGAGGGASGAGASAGNGASAAGGSTGGSAGAGATGGSAGGAGGSAGSGQGGNAFGMGGTLNIDAGADVTEEACAEVAAQATRIPLTLYIALDRSQSLGAKFDAAKEGLGAFLKDPASNGINVGLVTFPREPLLNPEECNFKNYKEPEVAFDKLPGNATKILDFLAKVKPNGIGTPIYPALGGTLDRSASEKSLKPAENFAVLLVTDGEPAKPPSTCTGFDALSVDNIGKFVADTLANFQVRTFVIGLPGISPDFATTLAQKGGTQAIVIDQDIDLKGQFQKALSQVLGEGLGCEFPLPPDTVKYDKDKVNVRYTKGDGSGTLDLDRSLGCKDGKGWDYDNDAKPTKVVLCSGSCDLVKQDGLAKVDVILGCPTRIIQ